VPTLTVTTRPAADIAADVLVIGARQGSEHAELLDEPHLEPSTAAQLTQALVALEATGKAGEVTRVVGVSGIKAGTVAVVGLGTQVTAETVRAGAATALRAVGSKAKVALALPTPDRATVAAMADGAYAGCYRYAKITGAAAAPATANPDGPTITLVSTQGAGKGVKDAVARAQVIGAARDWARDLVNTPPNLLTPAAFEAAVKTRVKATTAKITVSVLDEKALAKGGFGGIVGVGQGSAHPPRIVTMTWKPAGAKASIALVGKGITFDSGGLCIKPPASMATMKSDMAGAAAVAATVVAAAELGLPVAVTGYLCLAENMPGSNAQRPGDVVTMRDGTTVEIIDTDAEGRMVLGDGLALAVESGPDAIIDIATLTGAATIALGNGIAAVMANDDSFRDRVLTATGTAGEPAWPMPLPEDLRAGLDSQTADVAHKADRFGGMLTAGLFLRTFVPAQIPWSHLDIAGPAFNEKAASGMNPKGGTGYGVASLIALIEQYR